MPLLPGLQPLYAALDGMPIPADLPIAEMRAAMHAQIDAGFGALAVEHPPATSEVDHVVPVDGGEITVRVYRPQRDGNLPCHVYFHGGGFFLGTLDQANNTCRALAEEVQCAVASVDYRLAPEHRFPTAAEDAYASLEWVVEQAAELGIDPTRISVGGASAGGNLAAVVALMARDRGTPRLRFQVLEIPVTDFTAAEDVVFPEEGITIEAGKAYRDLYLGIPEDATNPYASPLLASDHQNLPPALVLCAEYDQLRPEGLAYAAALERAGVSVETIVWEGQFHGSQGMDKVIPEHVARYRASIAGSLRQAFAV